MSFKIIICLILATSYASGKMGKIIGGKNAMRIDFPYQAVLRRITDDYIVCGGAIISHKHILTAAHCVHEGFISTSNIKISLGHFNSSHMFISEYIPNRIYTHPQFTGGLDPMQSYNNDIAVVRIRENMFFDRYQNQILLPVRNIEHGQVAVVTGWGSITHPQIQFPKIMQWAKMSVVDSISCNRLFPTDIFHDQFCAYRTEGIGPCIGDGGTPLVRDGYVIGIFSISYLCASGLPDVYTNVYSHINFIRVVLSS